MPITEHPIYIQGPQGCGKTTHAETLMLVLGKEQFIDGIECGIKQPIPNTYLLLGQADPLTLNLYSDTKRIIVLDWPAAQNCLITGFPPVAYATITVPRRGPFKWWQNIVRAFLKQYDYTILPE